MNKDVIYIDVDDDVTAIIGKIKKADEKIVALVPPKHVGTLQSAVNLRLLDRMAKAEKKQLVLITANQALLGLAASTQIPVAKNLQSKPQLLEPAAHSVDESDDIIDGSQIPVGSYAKKAAVVPVVADGLRSEAIDATDLSIDTEPATPAVRATAVKKGKNRPKIPNFDSFRKKLFFGIAGGLAFIALLVWMFVFAPAATIIITASTSPQPISASVRLGGTAATDFKTGVVSSTAQELKKDETIEFEATGQKDIGEKATGTVRFSTSSFAGLGTIPAGTKLTTTGGLVFITDQAANLVYQGGSSASVTTTVTAAESGTKYNAATGSLSGAPANVNAALTGPTAGGTTQVVKVVSAEDIERAQGQLIGKSTDDQKKAVIKQFTNGEQAVDSSFTVTRGAAVSAPAVDQESSTGKATLTIPTTYTIQGIQKSDLESYLKAALDAKLTDSNTQKIYSTGIDSATVSNFRTEGENQLVTINATGRIGPKIDEAAIKEEVKGKKYGEVQQTLQSVDGIKDVDVQFSYFWVRTVPNNPDKIKIEFQVEDGE